MAKEKTEKGKPVWLVMFSQSLKTGTLPERQSSRQSSRQACVDRKQLLEQPGTVERLLRNTGVERIPLMT